MYHRFSFLRGAIRESLRYHTPDGVSEEDGVVNEGVLEEVGYSYNSSVVRSTIY